MMGCEGAGSRIDGREGMMKTKGLLIGVALLAAAAGLGGYLRWKTSPPWYQSWLDITSPQGCRFDSEFELKAGDTKKVEIRSETPLWVSWVTKNNEVITNNSPAVVSGRTEDARYRPGARAMPIFIEPEAGVISAYFRNASGVDTRLMVWTATEDQAPAFAKEGDEGRGGGDPALGRGGALRMERDRRFGNARVPT